MNGPFIAYKIFTKECKTCLRLYTKEAFLALLLISLGALCFSFFSHRFINQTAPIFGLVITTTALHSLRQAVKKAS